MRKKPVLILCVLSALLFIAGCAKINENLEITPSAQTTELTTNLLTTTINTEDDFLEWDEPKSNGKTPIQSMLNMASDNLDVVRFKYSPVGTFALETMNRSYSGLDDPASAAYWERLGLIKTIYDQEDEDHTWALYVPESYYKTENENRNYPLVFLWHGYMNPILVAEQYGFLEEAADKEYIAVIPWAANNDEYLTEADRLYDKITADYRIDLSRVYSTGFSLGGQVSLALALERSERFAAVAGCGVNATGAFYDENNQEVEIPVGHGRILEADFEKAGDVVPMMLIAGDSDLYHLLPYDTEDKVKGINQWLIHYGIDHPQTVENSQSLLAAAEDEVEKKIGLSFDETQIRSLDGLYYIGRFYDENHRNTVTVTALENGIHTTSRGMAQLVFDHFEKHVK